MSSCAATQIRDRRTHRADDTYDPGMTNASSVGLEPVEDLSERDDRRGAGYEACGLELAFPLGGGGPARSALLLPDVVGGDAPGDGQQPEPRRRTSSVARQRRECPQIRFLDEILDLGISSEVAQRPV